MDLISVRKVVGKIQANLFKNANSFSIGMLKSHFRGSGIQFKEHQTYTHGDDIRLIDWKLLAKSGVPYIKKFEEERNVEIIVVLDFSLTMFSGYKGISKLQAALEICCLLFLLTEKTNDRVRPIFIADEVVQLPLSSGEKGIVYLISKLEKMNILNPNGQININFRPKRVVPSGQIENIILSNIMKRKEVVLLSDFHDFLPPESLGRIRSKGKLHCYQLISPLDESDRIPFSLFSSNSIDFHSGESVSIYGMKNGKMKNELKKQFKILKVHERYLEQFIKEML